MNPDNSDDYNDKRNHLKSRGRLPEPENSDYYDKSSTKPGPYNFRGKDRNQGGGGFRGVSSSPRKISKVICSDCGVETEVPFNPTKRRPVYCRDCLPRHKMF